MLNRGILLVLCQTIALLLFWLAYPAMAAPPANDALTSAQQLTGTYPTVTGTNVDATFESGEPGHLEGQQAYASVWYKWTATDSNPRVLRTAGSNFDTVVSIHTCTTSPPTAPTYGTLVYQYDGDDSGDRSTIIFFYPTNGTTYYIAVDGYGGATGNISLAIANPFNTGYFTPAAPPAPVISATTFSSFTTTTPALTTNVDFYNLEINGGSVRFLTNLPASTPVTVSGLSAGTTYTVAFRAANIQFSTTGPGTDVTTAPAKPTFDNVQATSLRATAPTLPTGSTWNLQRATGTLTYTNPSTTNLLVWLKADAVTGVNTAAPLSSWTDSSGNGMTATQTATGAQPLWIANAANGRPAVRFDGAGDFLNLPAGFADFSAGLTAFVVARPAVAQTDARFFDLGNGRFNENVTMYRNGTSSGARYTVLSGAIGDPLPDEITVLGNGMLANNEWQVLTANHGVDRVARVWSNSHQLGTATVNLPKVVQRSRNFIGKSNFTSLAPDSDGYFQGDIAEILIYNAALTSMQQKSVEDYLTAKYCLATPTLPSMLTFSNIGGTQTTGSQYTDNTVNSANTYFYRYHSTGADGEAGAVVTAPGAPGVPTFTDIASSSLKVVAPASLPTGAASLTLQYKLSTDTNYGGDMTNLGASSSTPIYGLLAGQTYNFRFIAVGVQAGSTPGTAASATMAATPAGVPGPPEFLKIIPGQVTVRAPALPTGIVKMTLQRKPDSKADDIANYADLAADLGSNAISVDTGAFTGTGLLPGTRYTYRYLGIKADTTTVEGEPATAVVPPAPLSAPGLPNFSNLTSTTVTVTAPAVPDGASSLTLQVRPENSSAYTTIGANLGTGEVTDVTYPTGQTNHFFRYIAVAGTDAMPGNELSPTTMPLAPAAMTGTTQAQSFAFPLPVVPAGNWYWWGQRVTSATLQKKLTSQPDSAYVDWGSLSTSDVQTYFQYGSTPKLFASSLAPGTAYTFRWVVTGPAGTATSSATNLTTAAGSQAAEPAAPAFTSVGPVSLTVVAPALPANTASLKLQRRSGSTWTTLASGLAGGATTAQSSLTPLAQYTYRYVAVSTATNNPETVGQQASVSTDTSDAEKPGTPTIGARTSTTIVVTLPAIQFPLRTATLTLRYRLSEDPAGDAAYVDWTGGTTVTGLLTGRKYLFKVKSTPVVVGGANGESDVVGATTSAPAPGAPGAPQSVTVLDPYTVRVLAPATLPSNADYLTLLMLPVSQGTTSYTVVGDNIAPGANVDVGGLSPGATYRFKFSAAGSGGSTGGPNFSPDTVMPTSVTSWQAVGSLGTAIGFLIPENETPLPNGIRWNGIRQPEANVTVAQGAQLVLNAYTAFDWDQRDVLTNGVTVSTKVLDTCVYFWNVKNAGGTSVGSFVNGANRGQNALWTAPAAAGTYTLTLTVTDQDGANAATGETGTRNDSNRGTDAPAVFSRTITVP